MSIGSTTITDDSSDRDSAGGGGGGTRVELDSQESVNKSVQYEQVSQFSMNNSIQYEQGIIDKAVDYSKRGALGGGGPN